MSLTLETLPSLAAERCKVASGITAAPADQLSVHLPSLNLNIHCMSAEFQALCSHALVSEERERANAQSLRIIIGNKSTTPQLGVPNWEGQIPGLGAIYDVLEQAGFNGLYDPEYRSWQVLHCKEGHGFYLLDSPQAFAPWERAFPLRNFLHWAYAAQAKRLLHAATLGLNGEGVLLAGAGGAGKSGTTLSGILNGLKSCGDDYIGLEMVDGEPKAFPVMRLMKQDAKGLSRVGLNPLDRKFGTVNWQNKYEFDFETLAPDSRSQHLNIRAIFLPHIGSSKKTSLRPATTKEAMFALMPNNLQQLPGCLKQGFDIIGQLSRKIPAYHLELSQDPQEISDTVIEFLSERYP